jgi:hypothetical protein
MGRLWWNSAASMRTTNNIQHKETCSAMSHHEYLQSNMFNHEYLMSSSIQSQASRKEWYTADMTHGLLKSHALHIYLSYWLTVRMVGHPTQAFRHAFSTAQIWDTVLLFSSSRLCSLSHLTHPCLVTWFHTCWLVTDSSQLSFFLQMSFWSPALSCHDIRHWGPSSYFLNMQVQYKQVQVEVEKHLGQHKLSGQSNFCFRSHRGEWIPPPNHEAIWV